MPYNFRGNERTEHMIEWLKEKAGYKNKAEVFRTALAMMYTFSKHHEDLRDAIFKVGEEKEMIELKVGNKYTDYDKED